MNPNEVFVPQWAENQLKRMSAHDGAELEMLRHFYQSWEDLHALPNDKLHRHKAESAAQQLVEAAHVIRRFRNPAQIERLNGH